MKKVILSINALKAMSFLVQTVLSPRHTVIAVQDVVTGMKELKKKAKVDVVIIDIDNNTMENLEFIQHIKTSRLYANCMTLVLGSSRTIKENYMELTDVDQVFHKPFSPQLLVEYINDSKNIKLVSFS